MKRSIKKKKQYKGSEQNKSEKKYQNSKFWKEAPLKKKKKIKIHCHSLLTDECASTLNPQH